MTKKELQMKEIMDRQKVLGINSELKEKILNEYKPTKAALNLEKDLNTRLDELQKKHLNNENKITKKSRSKVEQICNSIRAKNVEPPNYNRYRNIFEHSRELVAKIPV